MFLTYTETVSARVILNRSKGRRQRILVVLECLRFIPYQPTPNESLRIKVTILQCNVVGDC